MALWKRFRESALKSIQELVKKEKNSSPMAETVVEDVPQLSAVVEKKEEPVVIAAPVTATSVEEPSRLRKRNVVCYVESDDDEEQQFSTPVAQSQPVAAVSTSVTPVHPHPQSQPTPNAKIPPSMMTHHQPVSSVMQAAGNKISRSVDCPICAKPVVMEFINQHIDSRCTSHLFKAPQMPMPQPAFPGMHPMQMPMHPYGFPPAGWRPAAQHLYPQRPQQFQPQPSHHTLHRSLMPNSPATKQRSHIPALAFDTMKEAALRKKLTDLGLSGSGTKEVLKQRYCNYRNMYNANLDAAHPKSDARIMSEFIQMERALRESSSKINHTGIEFDRKDHAVTEADEQAKEKYRAEHRQSFDDLIANIRARKKAKTST